MEEDLEFSLNEKLIIDQQSMEELPYNNRRSEEEEEEEDLKELLRVSIQFLYKFFEKIEDDEEEVKRSSEHVYEKIEEAEQVKRLSEHIKNNYLDLADWAEEKSCYRPLRVRPRLEDLEFSLNEKLFIDQQSMEELPYNNRAEYDLIDFQCGFVECPPKLRTWAKIDRHMDITGNMSSHLDNNVVHLSNRNVPRDPEFEFEFEHGYNYVDNQHMRKETVRRFSSFVVSADVFLGIVYKIWNSQLSIINVTPPHKEHNGHHSIWLSLLGLFGFMVFICAVAVMLLVGAAFTSMQKAMLLFWVILLYLQSANSISEVYVILVGGLFIGWYAFGKNSHHQMK